MICGLHVEHLRITGLNKKKMDASNIYYLSHVAYLLYTVRIVFKVHKGGGIEYNVGL